MRVRLSTQVAVRKGEPEVPLLTEQPLEYDFEPRPGDEIAVGPHGRWALIVTERRRVGLDGVLIVEGTLEQRPTGRMRNPLGELVTRSIPVRWMPDVIAASPEYLSNYLPPEDEMIVDPAELTAYIARKIENMPWDMSDLGILHRIICEWGEAAGIIPAEAA